MRAFYYACYIFLFLISSFCVQAAEDSGDKAPPPIPNPLQLDNNWWSYFTVPADQLPEKVQAFKQELDRLAPSSQAEEKKDIIKLKENIYLSLNLYLQVLNKLTPSDATSLQLLPQYTPSDILEVDRRLLQTQQEIGRLQDRVAFQNSRHDRLREEIDRLIIHYNQLAPSSYERLYTGLRIINLRIKIAIFQQEIALTKKTLSFRIKEKDQLNDELKNAKDKITYERLSVAELNDELHAKQAKLKEAKNHLDNLEKQSLKIDRSQLKNELICCLLDYQIITQSIRIENLNLEVLIAEVKRTLYDVALNPKTINTNNIQSAVTQWNKTLDNAKTEMNQWQKRLKTDHYKVSKVIADMVEDEKNGSANPESVAADIHLEIDQSFALLEDIQINISGGEELIQILQSRFVEDRSLSETWLIKAKANWALFRTEFAERTGSTLFYMKEQPITTGTLLKALLTVILALVFSKYFRSVLAKRVLVAKRFSSSTKYIILRLIHYVIIIIAILIALSFIGLDLTNIAIVAGALGVGIGFGLQTMVNNVISGFTLLLNRYLKVGDVVEIEKGGFATVKAINLQFTHICTFDGADQIVPNSELSARGLTNWTMVNSYRRFRIPFGVAYGTDKDRLRELILDAVSKEDYVLTDFSTFPNPEIWFMEYGDSSVNFELVLWVNLTVVPPHGTASSSILWVIDNVLNENEINIPFPQRDLFIKNLPAEFSIK